MEILGSSQGEELERPVKPKDFEKGFSKVQAKKGIEELMGKCVNGLMREKQRKIDKLNAHRRKIGSMYKTLLKELHIEPPYEPFYVVHTYLKFPLLVKDRKNSLKRQRKKRLNLVTGLSLPSIL